MLVSLLIVLCQLLSVAHNALVIEVQPSRIQPGLTDGLVINCSVTENKIPQMMKIYSLVLSRVQASNKDSFEELIILNYNERISTLNTSNVPEGSSGMNGASHITLTWPNPSYRDASRYKCEARGLSTSFNKISATAYASVETDEPDIRSLVDELLHLRKETYETSNSLKEVKQKYTSLNNGLQKAVKKLIREKDQAKKSLFHVSPVFQGRRYYLSRRQASNEIYVAQSTCAFFGGYLAEIDSSEEHSFIANFVNQIKDLPFGAAYIGLTENNGVWTNIYSKNDSTFLPWGHSEPNNHEKNEFCVVLERATNWRYNDISCYYNDILRYLCEIPE
ncbi:Neurocan core protein [Biomphalaria glabrata]|nr:Neurocan core protein [Biomphalaria glabrata]